MKARIIIKTEGQYIRYDIEADTLIPFMEIRGYKFSRYNDSSRQREELRGQPAFMGIAGPMWDGDAIRYECAETNRDMSA
jgi:hypothetical protein